MIAEMLSSVGRRSGPNSLTRGFGHVGSDPRTDLRAIADPRRAYPRLAAILAAVAVPVVLITAGPRVGSGFGFNDVVLLGAVFLAIATAAARLTWAGRDERWLFAIVAIEVVFVASLNTMTGGGGSPYFALYAPVLALAGWYLRGDLVAAAILLVGSTEVWRALAIERTGGAGQVTIALPFYAALAAISWLTAHRLTVALVTIRQAQVQTAAILDGVRAIGAGPTDDVLEQLVVEAERIFGGRAGLLAFQELAPSTQLLAPTEAGGSLQIPVTGTRGTHALLHLWRDQPFAASEIRLVAILAGAAGKAADAHPLTRGPLGPGTDGLSTMTPDDQ
ncbi:MAG: hypothetical protein NVS9B8_07880 [Candidatus Limnocylindrales bacterium]